MEIRIGVLLVVFFLLLAWALPSKASPVAQLSGEDGVTITLYDEPCAYSSIIKNLPYRATWKEKDKTFEGCAGAHPAGIIMFYFDDHTVGIAPMRAFSKLSGA